MYQQMNLTVTTSQNLFLSQTNKERQEENIQLSILTHLQSIGDMYGHENEWIGTKGQSRRLEGFILKRNTPAQNFHIQYFAHLQNYGDTNIKKEGQFVGTKGESRRLEGFAIYLVGQKSSDYNIYYQAHLQDFGDTSIHKNGQFCGTRGQSRRVQAIKVWIAKK